MDEYEVEIVCRQLSLLGEQERLTMEITIVDSFVELEQCFTIRKNVFVEEQGVPLELEMDEFDVSPDACCHILLKFEGVPAGTGRLITYKEHVAKIQRLAVLQVYRGKGFGGQLIHALEKQARLAGHTSCILDSQCHAESFYAQLGYSVISEQPFEDAGIMHVRMVKSLD
jgi:predicted GNAT family N-acyltransferase